MGLEWMVDFDHKEDGEIFYKTLQEIFEPLSTTHKTEYDKSIGHISQYSTRNENEKGVKDVSFYFWILRGTKKHQIMLRLSNEFAAEQLKTDATEKSGN